ncbi:ABC transporter transmembrane domain-containing protein [Neobacillus thermocopriae]|uniref:ABC transporter ATP-binding protein n=1 Tax=Neobacillus thermocopriae TaxID=1215031 RepID=UPI002E2313DC|nr:ABC transporter transmembrane domain-containing protein [Neobacillus thermocopriae]MED3624155.1 ABC transporter transmembrane domain-containing protein [Neobacillus thermocopriae]MED3713650.1 ABC transporter transmembrane domain-containing protein [Neobacillus thermocopriae]
MKEQFHLSKQEQRKVLFRLLSYTKPHKKRMVIAFLLLLMTTILEIILPILVKIFIDDYLTPEKLEFQPLFLLGTLYMGIQVVKALLLFFQLVKFQEIALLIIQQLRIDVFSKVQALGLKYFDQTPAGSIVSRVTNDTEAIKDMFVTVLATFIQSGFLLGGIFVAMFLLNVKLALFCVVLIPILIFVIHLYRKWSSKYYLDMRERLSQLNAKLNESLQGMAIIQVFRQEKRLRQEFGVINHQHYHAGMKNIKIDGLLLRPAIDLIYIFALILVLSYFGVTSFETTVKIGVIYAFINYLERFFEPVNQMMMRLSLFQQAIVAGSRVFKLLDEEELAPAQKNSSKTIEQGKIEFKNVSFSYDGKRDVLKNISFTAHPGETVALVGHTGSGKSSIINLMMRFYEFDRGDIFIDGESIRNYSKKELRNKLGLVLQDPFLFFGTVKDNIRLHNKDLTDEQVKEAAKFVQAHRFIERLENGYEHQVVERGATFSSGQRQLIAFARTIAANPKILILDEATANIDTETEEEIQMALSKMRKGRTTIAIAHRLSTIQDADLILVLHQGEIVERGTHQELLSLGGLYYKMFLLQNGAVEHTL